MRTLYLSEPSVLLLGYLCVAWPVGSIVARGPGQAGEQNDPMQSKTAS
jgi:hypothetical protein